MNDVFDKEFKFLEEWLYKSWNEDENVSLVAEAKMNKFGRPIAEVKESLNEEIENAFKEDKKWKEPKWFLL